MMTTTPHRVLPGFQPDSKLKMLLELKEHVEVVIAICASDIEKSKLRNDLGITYDEEVLRLIDAFRSVGLYVGSVVLTRYDKQARAEAFRQRLQRLGRGRSTCIMRSKATPTMWNTSSPIKDSHQ